jgi:L-cysteine S-thiosulfotransferase
MNSAVSRYTRRACAALLFFAISTATMFAGEIPLSERKSGYALMSPETQKMQDDRTSNPGTLWVLEGETLWNQKGGAAGKSCAGCHGKSGAGMKGVAVRYPAYGAAQHRPINLEQRINTCRTERQKAPAFAYESKELLALAAFVASQSHGRKIEPPSDKRLTPFRNAGREMFNTRQGQLNLSCAQCHNDNWGRKLSGAVIPQAHPTGYPLYRLEWQSLGSLQRRLRNCLIGMRSEPFEYGAPEYVALELYLMSRARGMRLETPAVRP